MAVNTQGIAQVSALGSAEASAPQRLKYINGLFKRGQHNCPL